MAYTFEKRGIKFMKCVSDKIKYLIVNNKELKFEDLPERSNSYERKLLLDKLSDEDYLKYFKQNILPELKPKLAKFELSDTYDSHAIRYTIPRMLNLIERLQNDSTKKS